MALRAQEPEGKETGSAATLPEGRAGRAVRLWGAGGAHLRGPPVPAAGRTGVGDVREVESSDLGVRHLRASMLCH